ncbi:hypothetical protein L861_15035 [Litchfieldella anticariensis FP35 = DSM 16096]|uniref:Uncharacterized protein n=1 Tax=Litchfieldella anticariensis (strain DSM 16096 / CECT 5854 / CIP 108499 / LMG 22089 / FP35) TaxID=1121939 RepID=S2L3N2_LITA3|nr:hypothetical protein L861_15035 [Halomonas anticariensis FP35 = DSM 16096]
MSEEITHDISINISNFSMNSGLISHHLRRREKQLGIGEQRHHAMCYRVIKFALI